MGSHLLRADKLLRLDRRGLTLIMQTRHKDEMRIRKKNL
jgi:hypothetical protein